MTTGFVSAELKIRLNSILSCNDIYEHIIDSQNLSKVIKPNER